jgi:hypothetical protein
MQFISFDLNSFIKITFDQPDEFKLNDKVIKVIPAHEFLTFNA